MYGSNSSLSSSRIRYERDAGAPPSSERWWTSRIGVRRRAATSPMLAPRPGRYDRSSVGFALSLLLVSLGVVLVVHHRIPPAVQPEVIAGGAVLIVLGVAGL